MPDTENEDIIIKTNTTYDEVYKYFISITRVDEYDLPISVEGMYDLINNGRMEFNLRREDDLAVDDVLETLDRKLNGLELMLFGNCMKLVVFRNMLSDFTSNFSMFQKEIGIKDYKPQLDGRNGNVFGQEKVINEILFKMQEDFQ